MISWWASALAAPLLEPELPTDPLARCAAEAEAVGGTLPAPPDPLPVTDKVAIVVGVPCHRTGAVPSLAYATRDAVRVGEQLAAGGFTVVPLLTVVDRAQVEAALERARAAIGPDGTVVVYFSGHGILREEQGRVSRYLVLSDTDPDALASTALSVQDLDWQVGTIEAAQRVIVQDTCFASRGDSKAGGGSELTPKGFGVLELPVRLEDGDLRLYASRFFEQAVESPELRGSVYTAHLLDALARPADADLDGDGCVGLIEGHAWAAVRTEIERDGFQVPQIRARGAENLVLGCTPSSPTRAVVVPPAGEGWLRISDPSGRAAPARSGVAPGRYRVQVSIPRDDGLQVVPEVALDRRFVLSAGQWLDLDAELDRRAPLLVAEASGAVVATGLGATDETGQLAAGLGAWAAPRDRGAGRPILGVAARTMPGPGFDPLYRKPTAEVVALGGWSWSPGWDTGEVRLGLGPALESGLLWRTVRYRDPVSVATAAGDPAPTGRAPPSVGWVADPQVRLWAVRGRLAGSLSTGVRVLPLAGETWVRLEPAPFVRIGLGAVL